MSPVVVVVDENPTVVDLMSRMLASVGHAVIGCFDFAEAQAVIAQQRPDAVLLELRRRNEYAGWSLLRRLRQDDETRDIPLLVTSGDVALLSRYETELATCGVEILRKPFPVEVLAARLATLMRRRPIEDVPAADLAALAMPLTEALPAS